MKKITVFFLMLIMTVCLTGCSETFEPTESTIFVASEGNVKNAIMESFDKDYYDFDELFDDVEKTVKSYNLDVNEERIKVESLTQGNDEVTLIMDYQDADCYSAFNEVLLFTGTYAEAIAKGYIPQELYDSEGQSVDPEEESLKELKVVVTEESVCIQTSGRVKYISDNVTLMDKKLARALEAGKMHPAFVLYK